MIRAGSAVPSAGSDEAFWGCTLSSTILLWVGLGILVHSGLSGALWHLGLHDKALCTLASSSGCMRSGHSSIFFPVSGVCFGQ